ncbi:prolipoprotein diacylglyceryl transferase [Candidatus Curtissbacteria bacterium]|nr:prolipoprotein diacylglyceryl transferase [Candidatus Curtissbacteria bacterium]
MEQLKTINLGPLTIHVYGLIIATAIVTCYFLAKKRSHIYKIPTSVFDSLWIFTPLVLGVIGGRIYHVLDKWSLYAKNPISMLWIANGGLGIWGAIAGIALGFYIFSKAKKVSFFKLLDLVAPFLLLSQAIGRIGNYVNQEGFGPPTNLPWGVPIDIQNRPAQYLSFQTFHPTFFYEAILDIIGFLFLLKVAKKYKSPGQIFGHYLVYYSISRFVTEIFRIDTWEVDGFKISFAISIAALLIGAYLFKRKNKAV